MDDGRRAPCDCSGSMQSVHLDRLARWCRETAQSRKEPHGALLPLYRRRKDGPSRARRAGRRSAARLPSASAPHLQWSSRTADPSRAGPWWITPSPTSTVLWRPKRRSVDACTSEGVPPDAPEERGGVQVACGSTCNKAQVLNTLRHGPPGFRRRAHGARGGEVSARDSAAWSSARTDT